MKKSCETSKRLFRYRIVIIKLTQLEDKFLCLIKNWQSDQPEMLNAISSWVTVTCKTFKTLSHDPNEVSHSSCRDLFKGSNYFCK